MVRRNLVLRQAVSFGAPRARPARTMEGGSRLGDLRSEKRTLADALVANHADAKRLRRAMKRTEEAAARAWNLNEFEDVRRVVLIIYTLADFCVLPAAVYLAGAGGRRHWPRRADADIATLIEQCFLEADLEDVAALSDIDDPRDVVSMRTAVACVEQWRSATWCRAQNERRGVAPDTAAVMVEYERARANLPADIRPNVWLGQVGARKRATRWRQRWGGRLGVLRPRDILPVHEMLEKAALWSPSGSWSPAGFGLDLGLEAGSLDS